MIAVACGCERVPSRYTYDFFDTFDTYVQITGYARSEEAFREFALSAHARMRQLHALFDIYNDYEGIANAKTVNDAAGTAAIKTDPILVELVARCIEYHKLTQGSVDIALGPVLKVWHDARERAPDAPGQARVPSMEELEALRSLCDIRDVLVDEEDSTIYLARTGMRLDLGAAAKGFAVEVVAREADLALVSSFLISAGGNVLAQATPPDGAWRVGLLDPERVETDGGLLGVMRFTDASAVTSGDYQRYYEVEGVRYGHIVDPKTLLPAREYRSVTVVGPRSGVADLLSTALFILPLQEGRALAESLGYDAIWVSTDGIIDMTRGAEAIFRTQ